MRSRNSKIEAAIEYLAEQTLRLTAGWVVLSAVLTLAGWVFSVFHILNTVSYLLLFAVLISVALLIRKRKGFAVRAGRSGNLKELRHFPPAVLYACLMILIFIGGMLYAPSNYDALSYRIPRVLHWLSESGWYWIPNVSARMNIAPTATEWILCPWLLLFKSERFFFLVQYGQFLLLPGLVYTFLRSCGAQGKHARMWMWLFPSGYGIVLQAGSVGNDITGVFYFLAAMATALIAAREKKFGCFAISFLAMGLATNSKASNLPLALPWLLAVAPACGLILKKKISSMLLLGVAAGISFLPHMGINYVMCGDWSGASLMLSTKLVSEPVAGVIGNILWLNIQNFALPAFPWAPQIDADLLSKMSIHLKEYLAPNFEGAFCSLGFAELQIEESAGMGIGVSSVLIIFLLLALWACRCRRLESPPQRTFHIVSVFLGGGIAILVFMMNSGICTAARIFLPYTVLLMAGCVWVGRREKIIGPRVWSWIAASAILSSCLVVVLTPARPLWPALTVLNGIKAPSLRRARTVYQVYRDRPNVLRMITEKLPADETSVGFITAGDDMEAQLWRPYGQRKIVNVSNQMSRESLQADGVRTIVVRYLAVKLGRFEGYDEWIKTMKPCRIEEQKVPLLASAGPETWQLITLE